MFCPGGAPGVYPCPPRRYAGDTQRYSALPCQSEEERAAQYAEYDEPCYPRCPSPDPFRRGIGKGPLVAPVGSFDDEFPPIAGTAPPRLFAAKIVSSGPGSRPRSMPPGPNNWTMELQWEPVQGAASAFTTDPESALRSVANKFALAWLGGGFEGGTFYSSMPLSARSAPRPIPPSEFFWQEPYHTPFPDTAPELEDAVLAELLQRVAAAS